MEAVKIDESIRVGVAFDNRRAIPTWFLWRNRYYRVKSVNFNWCSSTGVAKLHYYAVTDGINTYELCFNSITLEWTLGKVCGE